LRGRQAEVAELLDGDLVIATRYLPALGALLALACIPTIIHSYAGTTVMDGRSAASLPLRLNGAEGRPSGRSVTSVQGIYAATDFVERQYGRDLTLFVARSYDFKRLYHHPEHAVARGDGYEGAVVERPEKRPEIPIFVLKGTQQRVSVYALLYEDEFVENPIRFQLHNALTSLIRPRSPMTLFFVRGKAETDPPDSDASRAEALLLAAIDSFLAQPLVPGE
jgi:hypothetical protein